MPSGCSQPVYRWFKLLEREREPTIAIWQEILKLSGYAVTRGKTQGRLILAFKPDFMPFFVCSLDVFMTPLNHPLCSPFHVPATVPGAGKTKEQSVDSVCREPTEEWEKRTTE